MMNSKLLIYHKYGKGGETELRARKKRKSFKSITRQDLKTKAETYYD